MAEHVITLEGALPPSMNELLRMHWSKARKIGKTYEALIAYQGGARIPRAEPGEKRSVRIDLFKGTRGKPDDPSNLDGRAKLILDAMKRLGLIHDDDAEHCELVIVEHMKSSERLTRIKITTGE
jgi:Holliday junction resolvase RusA-like endonuclease